HAPQALPFENHNLTLNSTLPSLPSSKILTTGPAICTTVWRFYALWNIQNEGKSVGKIERGGLFL
ncbi:hypothetical protein ACQP3J_31710, partial [Escherichia coli]